MAASAFGQQAYMLEQGVGQNPPPGPGATTIFADPGETLTIMVYFADPNPTVCPGNTCFNGYQLIIPWFASGGDSGTVEYNNLPPFGPPDAGGNSVQVDKANTQWVFANTAPAQFQPISYNETAGSIFGVVFNYFFQQGIPVGPGSGVPNPGAGNYMMNFQMNISPDACGTFDLPFNIPPANPPLSAIFDPNGGAYANMGTTFKPLQIIIGPPNDDCADAAPAGTGVAYSTCCATQDGPADCGIGGDVWYELTTSVANCDLNVSVTGGATVATYVGANCTPAGPGQCGNIVDQPVPVAGTHILVQVIGDCVEGTVTATCGGCVTAADCNDNNACTTDSCNAGTGACSNVNNTLPCSDNNVCTVGDVCGGGSCNGGPVNSCNDFLGCTVDTCDPAAGGNGCVNDSVNGDSCTTNAECATGTCVDGTGGACDPGEGCTCDCEDANTDCPNNSLCLNVRDCDNGPDAVGATCSSDADCEDWEQCSDNNQDHADGGICVDQCCYSPDGKVTVDLEVGQSPGLGVCGVQAFLHYDTSCLTFGSLTIDPDDRTDLDFVIVNQKNTATGDIDLVLSLPPGTICGVDSPNPNVPNDTLFVGGTVARLSFTATGDCKCGGVTFRPHNPATKVTGPKGDITPLGLSNTDEININDAPDIACPPDSSDHSDCGSIFRTVTYGPVTITDDCDEVTCLVGGPDPDGPVDPQPCCSVEFRKACQTNLDCGRGIICGPATDCGPESVCETDPLVEGSGFVCDGVKCTGYCTIDTCVQGVCNDPRDPQTIDLEDFLDCSDGCQLPPGEVRLVCEFTNSCGRTATCSSRQFNSGLNELCVDIELSPSMLPGNPNDPIERCIDLSISECDAAGFPVCHAPYGTGVEFCSPLDQNACSGHPEACFPPAAGNTITVSTEVVFGLPENIAGHGTACVKIPPGNWTCLTATDPKHSLTSTCTVECVDNSLHAEFKGSKDTNDTCHWLVQGNLNGGPNIDIADYTILAGEYLTNYNLGDGTGEDSPCKTGPVEGNNFHADFNGDGLVTLADWTHVVFNFFNSSKDPCEVVCQGEAAVAGVRDSKPRDSMTRAELEKIGLGAYVEAADVTGDGVVNLTDMAQFLNTVGDDGSGAATIEDLKEAVRKIERSERTREVLPRTKRSR